MSKLTRCFGAASSALIFFSLSACDPGTAPAGTAELGHAGHALADESPPYCVAGSEEVAVTGATNGDKDCPDGKVAICHYPPGNPSHVLTLCIGAPAVAAHTRYHGDLVGPCPPASDAGTPGGPPACETPPATLDSDRDGVPDDVDCDFACPPVPEDPTDGGSADPSDGGGQGAEDGGSGGPGPGGEGEGGQDAGQPAGSNVDPGPEDGDPISSPPMDPRVTDPTKDGYSGWGTGCTSAGGSATVALALLALALGAWRSRSRVLACAIGLLALGVGRSAQAEPMLATATGASTEALGPISTHTHELPAPPSALAHARLHVLAAGFGEGVSRQAGLELGATLSATGNVDFGVSTVLGRNVGFRALADLHPLRPNNPPLLPFLQLRGIVHPVPEGVGIGGGIWAGLSFEAGPGRARGGLLAEGYLGPRSYYPQGLFLMFAYEVDLLKPERILEYRDRLVEVVRERTVPIPGATAFKVLVTDLDDKPVTAQVRVTAETARSWRADLQARPEAQTAMAPGTYRAEVVAPGYLLAGSNFTLNEGETRVEHFRLRPIPPVAVAHLTPQRIDVTQRVDFELNEARLLPSAFPILDEVVDILLRHPELHVRVEGHTCHLGSAEYNQDLSDRRARSVAEYLGSKGVHPRRLLPVGFGLTRPLFGNETEEGRSKNRRVQFELIPTPKPNASAPMSQRPSQAPEKSSF